MAGRPEEALSTGEGSNKDKNPTLITLDHVLPGLLEANHCYVAYSGGVDSHVLLHLASRSLPVSRITALHINHQLSPNADQWAAHCQSVCQQLGVGCEVVKVTVEKSGLGVEGAARKARYLIFEQQLRRGSVLLMAHHGDDQVETMLYRLIRGSGAGGVAGMPVTRPLGEGRLIRPLLGFSRQAIHRYAQANNLVWVDDESNDSPRFDRNYLRSCVIPQLAARWPDYLQRLSHTARLLDESQQLNDSLAAMDLAKADETGERLGVSIDSGVLSGLPANRQRNLLRFWVRTHGLPVPGDKLLAEIRGQVLTAAADAQPRVDHGSAAFCRYRRRLYLIPALPELTKPAEALVLSPDHTLTLPDGSRLSASLSRAGGLLYSGADTLAIRFRQGGERCQPAGRHGSNTLKKLLQEYRLEPWLRDRVPLIYLNDSLAAVGDLWVCESFRAKPGESALAFHWAYPQQDFSLS